MSRYINVRDSAPIIKAAQEWVENCLVLDGSVFSDEVLWTTENLSALDQYFVKRPDAGEGTFYEKLKGQLDGSPSMAHRLMAEMLWSLFLFPSNISTTTKREAVVRVWNWSGAKLDPTHPLLADAILNGIGSCGMAINNHRWRELHYMISMLLTVKKMSFAARRAVFNDYDAFCKWITSLTQDGDRQFRHMLRYFLFPDRVERISTNRDRISILDRFKRAPSSVTRKWSDRELDDELLSLRQSMEVQYDTKDLDFYASPLREVWKAESETDDAAASIDDEGNEADSTSEDVHDDIAEPRNLILYGPPGTGKTFRLQQLREQFTDQPADVDRKTWETELVAHYGWRATIAAALALLDRPVKVVELIEHPLMRAKALQRERTTGIGATTWAYLQEHTPPEVPTVNTAIRRMPAIFSKDEAGGWSLVDDWRDRDPEAAGLFEIWRNGPGGAGRPIQRYRFVTFHPSYSYEDFVVGLRPVSVNEGEQQPRTEFRMVDGVFKQICAQAKANPGKRYALFIDEINRANIAKVFGELITLIEGDKRARYSPSGDLIGGIEIQLPGVYREGGGDEKFGVPANLDIYGTMNTADRSIALLDIALRRRFEFEALDPIYSVIDRRVDTVDLSLLLERINSRLEYLADRDRQIGHAYFNRVKSLGDLQRCFQLQVIPLLQEYFFDDWGNVTAVLSDKSGKCVFIEKVLLVGSKLFPGGGNSLREARPRFRVTDCKTWTAEAFRGLYAVEDDIGHED
jgi:5-methylcytosine-specific restriction enzyme B